MAWYFGSDSGTSSNPCGMNFYLGRMGYGTTVSIYWTVTSTSIPAFAYWNIEGPGNTPSGKTYQEWGAEQAQAFWNQFWNQQYPGGYPRGTMFGSVSLGSGGLNTANDSTAWSENQAVVEGFLNELAKLNAANSFSSSTTLGLYGSQTGEFQDLLDSSNWTSPEPIVVWIAATQSSQDCTTVEGQYCPMPTVGGYFPMIWQYYQDPDYDVTPYAGGVNSSSNYTWHPTTPPGIC
ncbi:hypothetical protein [Ferrimicrobium sp.]|uniref:hypothetical protein n=1 Tax=Ferrimicrobium sp. TaxID=2926050 RepID=UPI0026292A65|nr:hypothetical protein [Ferrimicrobium sp.]